MKEELLKCLVDVCPNVDFEKEDKLVDDGVLDSLSIIKIISALSDIFHVSIDADDIISENFNSFFGLYNMVIKKMT